jgi:thiol-disulfide isomerase/thioredoxin
VDPLRVFARVVLSAVFVVAAGAKLLDRKSTRRSVTEFGAPERLAATVAVLLPLTELAVAVLLLRVDSAAWGGFAASILLLVFTAMIGVNLLLGRRPPCRCFGSADTRPIGWRTLVRNGVLLAVAGFVVWAGPGPSIVALTTVGAHSEVVRLSVVTFLVAAVAVQGWLILHVIRQHGRFLLRLDALESQGGSVPELVKAIKEPRDLEVGEVAPGFQLPSLAGGSIGLNDLCSGGKKVLLIFLDPGCEPCMALVPDIEKWQREHRKTLRIAVLGGGWEQAVRARALVSGVSDVLSDEEEGVTNAYAVFVTPGAVLVDPAGTIGSRVATGEEDIAKLVALATEAGTARKKT